MDLNNKDSPTSVLTSLSGEYLATELFSSQPDFQLSTNWIAIASQPPLQSSTELPTLNSQLTGSQTGGLFTPTF
jgi:hypothetical protein